MLLEDLGQSIEDAGQSFSVAKLVCESNPSLDCYNKLLPDGCRHLRNAESFAKASALVGFSPYKALMTAHRSCESMVKEVRAGSIDGAMENLTNLRESLETANRLMQERRPEMLAIAKEGVRKDQ